MKLTPAWGLSNSCAEPKSLWSWLFGNASGTSTAGRPWYFKLTWQNNCSTEPQPCGFTLYPDNPRFLAGLAVDASSQATVMKRAALDALRKAFDKYPVDVNEGRSGTGDHRANVVDGVYFDGSSVACGLTPPIGLQYDSKVYYRKNMEEAQFALPIQLNTAQDVQNALQNIALMKAVGTAIGNNAAHEFGHQFFSAGAGMDDSSINTYNGQGCDGSVERWIWGFGPIQWEGIIANAWKNALGTGWH